MTKPTNSDRIALYAGRSGLRGSTFADFQVALFATITDLAPVTTPAATDEFAVVQADGIARKETRGQIHALEVGEHLLLPQVDEFVTPTLAFGDGDSGFYENADDQLSISLSGTLQYRWSGVQFFGTSGGGPLLRNVIASDINPTMLPNRSDFDTGMGQRIADVGVLIAGGVNVLEFGEAGGVPLIGFYSTAAIAQQAGVAVTAAGIHAACVALGLFTA